MLAIHFVIFKPGPAKLGTMVEYRPAHVIVFVWYRVWSRDCQPCANGASPSGNQTKNYTE